MRVFIAIDVPGEIRQRLAAMQDELRQASSSARWVYGGVDSHHAEIHRRDFRERRCQDIDTALAGLTWKPLSVSVRGVGFFPGTRSPRVFWAGLECSTMEGLAEEIDSRLERAGFDSEERAFRAHLTLARTKETRLESALVKAAAQFEETEFGTFMPTAFISTRAR